MTEQQTPTAQPIRMGGRGAGVTEGSTDPQWDDVVQRLRTGGWRWLTTLREGQPHTRPVFAAWSDGTFFIASKSSTQKTRNLDVDGRCSVAADVDSYHLVVEGVARRVLDEPTLGRASTAFQEVYGWATTIAGDELDAEYGAPTSGGPPYRVYQVTPTTVHAFPASADFIPTRWSF
ncbi:pyridoxamine 5'-phosphate oxidase family protein [Microlunatus sp. GCM10028923]|uniref:pyridoxamine 5'-phosphate oxidase family protein n=1 Tax=Microlunatus sp. GCM10028923 TaxID=3273400 RepID=UPI00361CC69C